MHLSVILLILLICADCYFAKSTENNDNKNNLVYRSTKSERSLPIVDKPKVSICCSPGTFRVSWTLDCTNNNTENEPIYELSFPMVFTENLKPIAKRIEDFEQVFRNPCEYNNFAYNLSTDPVYLIEDGRLYVDNSANNKPNNYLNIDEYCLANWMGKNGTYLRILGCLPEYDPDEVPIAYTISLALSLPFLLATFCVYALLPELRNIHGMTLMACVASLFWAFLLLAVVQFEVITHIDTEELCTIAAFVIHFSFLSSFFWLNVMCFDIWWTFGGFRGLEGSVQLHERKKFIIYSVYAWGCASIMTGLCIIMDYAPGIPDYYIKPKFGEESCWFSDDASKAIYFYGPMGLTVICNICLFISTALKILKHKRDTATQLQGTDSRRHDDNKQWFNLYLKLFIVMGINWAMEIISWLLNKNTPDWVWYLTDLTNTLQGVIIFIIFVWKDRIKNLLMKRFGCSERSFQSRNSTRSGCNSSISTKVSASTAPLQDKNHFSFDKNRVDTTTTDESDFV